MCEALTLNKQAEAAKKLAGLNLHTEYRTGTSDPIKDFYVHRRFSADQLDD